MVTIFVLRYILINYLWYSFYIMVFWCLLSNALSMKLMRNIIQFVYERRVVEGGCGGTYYKKIALNIL